MITDRFRQYLAMMLVLVISTIAHGETATGSTTLVFEEDTDGIAPEYNKISTTLTIYASNGFGGTTAYPSYDDTYIIDNPKTLLNEPDYSQVDIEMEIDTTNDQVVSFTLSNGRTFSSDTNFIHTNGFYLSYNITLTNNSSSVYTINSPCMITNPATGEYQNSDHTSITDLGTITGWTKYGLTGAQTPITPRDFSTDPGGGPGGGIGHITLTRLSEVGGIITYEVEMTQAVNADEQFIQDSATVRIQSIGNIRSTGTVQAPTTPYIGWTMDEGVVGAPPEGDLNGDGVPNIFAWGLGLGASDNAAPHLPKANPDGSYIIQLPGSGTAGDILIETSATLGSWTPLDAARSSLGVNPIPAGTANTVTITSSGLSAEFIRFSIDE